MHSDHDISASNEEYLEWVYRLSKEQVKVTASDLAQSLQVSRASVTGMLKRLVEQGLANHLPYGGITLTPKGQQVADRIIRRHGLLERLLCDVVGVPWHRVDEVVCQLEHYLDEEVTDRLARFLSYPTTCPHGQPIDWNNAIPAIRLSDLSPGQSATVARIGKESPDFLEFLESMRIMPGNRISIQSQQPFGGPVIINVGDKDYAIGMTTAKEIWVESASIEGPGECGNI